MRQVVLVVDAEVEASQPQVTSSPTTNSMVTALRQAIITQPEGASTKHFSTDSSDLVAASAHDIQVISVSQLLKLKASQQVASSWLSSDQRLDHVLFCPLTLNLPSTFAWSRQTIYQQCQDVDSLRQWVEQQGLCAIGQGYCWLPIALTAKGPLYGEVIAVAGNPIFEQPLEDLSQLSFYQPLHLADDWRQPLYKLGFRLLRSLSAPPATYLIQFGFEGQQICFDRLWPFPAAPAIASLGRQTPDLFMCHWLCLTNQPILDLVVTSAQYQVYPG